MDPNIYTEIGNIQSIDEITKVAAVATARLTVVKEQQQQLQNQVIPLTDDHVKQLKNIVDVAVVCGIGVLKIGNDSIRGIDAGQSVTIINNGANGLPFNSIVTAQASMLKRTLHTVQDLEDRVSEFRTVGNEVKLCFSGTLNGMKARVQFECSPLDHRIKTPGSINDTFESYSSIGPVGRLHSKIKIQKLGAIQLIGDGSGLSLELRGYPQVISYPLQSEPTAKPVSNYYGRVLLKLLRQYKGLSFQVGAKGVLKTDIDGLDVFVLPHEYPQ